MKQITNNTLPGGSSQDVQATADRLRPSIGFPKDKHFPTEYYDFISENNGGVPNNPYNPGTGDGKAYTIDRFLSISTNQDPSVLNAWNMMAKQGFHANLVPIARTTQGNYLAYDLGVEYPDNTAVYVVDQKGNLHMSAESLTELLEHLEPMRPGQYTHLSIEEIRADFLELTQESDLTLENARARRQGFWGKVKAFFSNRIRYLESVELLEGPLYRYAQKGDYRNVFRRRVVIPQGLRIGYAPYLDLLGEQQSIASAIHTDVLGPYVRFLGRLVSNPELMASHRAGTLLSEILKLDLEGSRSRLSKAFSSRNEEIAPIENLMDNGRQWSSLLIQYNRIATQLMHLDRTRILKEIDDASSYLDEMMSEIERMSSEGDEPTQVALDELTRLSYLVAEHVEALGVLVYNMRALGTSISSTAKEFATSFVNSWNIGVNQVVESSKSSFFGRGVSSGQIERAEKELGVTFGPLYRAMLTDYNEVGFEFTGPPIYTRTLCHISRDRDEDVVKVTNSVRGDRYNLNKGDWVLEDRRTTQRMVIVLDSEDRVFRIDHGGRDQVAEALPGYVKLLSLLSE